MRPLQLSLIPNPWSTLTTVGGFVLDLLIVIATAVVLTWGLRHVTLYVWLVWRVARQRRAFREVSHEARVRCLRFATTLDTLTRNLSPSIVSEYREELQDACDGIEAQTMHFYCVVADYGWLPAHLATALEKLESINQMLRVYDIALENATAEISTRVGEM